MFLAALLTISFAFWIVFVPVFVWGLLPQEIQDYLAHAPASGSGTQQWLVLFLVVPFAFGIASMLGLITWALLSKPFVAREEIEAFLTKGIFGARIGRLESRVLDVIFGKRQ